MGDRPSYRATPPGEPSPGSGAVRVRAIRASTVHGVVAPSDAPPSGSDPGVDPTRAGPLGRLLGLLPTWRVAAGCVLAGVLLAGSLPPWGFWPLAFAGIALVDRLLADRPAGSRAGRMWLVALVLFAITLIWMKELTAPGYVIAVVVFAAMFALAGVAVPPGRGRHLALPGAWVLAEAFKGHWPFGGVPISDLALGQVAGPLADLARVGGAPLLGGAAVVVGVVIAAFVAGPARDRRIAGAVAVGVVALTAWSTVAPHGTNTAEPVRVAAVQGGGPQGTKAIFTDMDEVFARHLRASEDIEGPVDVIVWPEDVVDLTEGDIADPDAAHGPSLSALARTENATVIAGIVQNEDDDAFRNFSVVIDPDGTFHDRYDKVHRVPFGEYVPLRAIVEPFAGPALTQRDAIPGTGPAVLRTDDGPFGVVISWEVFFGDRARAAVRDGGQILINPTNGSTYTGTLVQTQQVAASRLRALETGRWVVQVAPTGFSAVIDPDGRVLERSAISEARVLQADVPRRTGFTWYTRTGPLPVYGLALLAVAGGWFLAREPVADPDAGVRT